MQMTTEKDRIGSCPLFQNLNEKDLTYAFEFFHAKNRTFDKGEGMKRPGEKLPFFGLVLSGNVEVYMDDIDGNHLVMAYVEEGETFGESLCYLGRPNPVGIVAATDCEVLFMDCERIQSAGTKNELDCLLGRRFTAMLAERTLDMNNRIQVLSKLSIRDKLMTFFARQQLIAGKKTFEIAMDRERLAAYLGTNRSALSRELSRMKEEGIIDFDRNVFRL